MTTFLARFFESSAFQGGNQFGCIENGQLGHVSSNSHFLNANKFAQILFLLFFNT